MDFIRSLIETLLRSLPFPTKTGLRVFGKPNQHSPVFVTANFDLTVRRVARVLTQNEIDCYLLVVNTKGINVWCAAKGGHFTADQVVSAIKTSDIGGMVDHRQLVLPQLCASGVNPKEIHDKTGWHAKFGPVYARYIPPYIKNGFQKTAKMNLVEFPLIQRLEMAAMWAFPMTILIGILFAILWRNLLPAIVPLIWVLALLLFTLYFWLPGKPSLVTALVTGGMLAVGVAAFGLFASQWGIKDILILSLSTVFIAGIIGIDFPGSSPLFHSEWVIWTQERGLTKGPGRFKVAVNPEDCNGCGICVDVCPRGVYELDKETKKAIVSEAEKCENCTACFKQCPEQAISIGTPVENFYQ
ncbi:MAG: HgcAB-like fusion protein [Dehalococcoidales bacterium]